MDTPKKSKWKTWHKVVLGIVVLFILIGVFSKGDKKANAAPASTDNANATPLKKQVGIGEVLHTSYFDITVNNANVSDRVTTGNEFADLKKENGNKYLVIDITIKNTDKESRMMFEGEVEIVNNGTKYTYENTETVVADGWGMIMENINPLVTKHTKLVYKVPEGVAGDIFYHPARSESDETILLGNIK